MSFTGARMRRLLSTGACAVALLAIACGPTTPAVDARAGAPAIRALDDQWNAAIAKKDVVAINSNSPPPSPTATK